MTQLCGTHCRWSTICCLLVLVGCLAGCGRGRTPAPPASTADVFVALSQDIAWRRLDSRAESRDAAPIDGPRFEALSAGTTGIDFEHRWDSPPEHALQLDNAMAGGGVCIGDYDDDGRVDVYLTRPQGGGRLYRNLGDFRFEDVTSSAGVDDGGVWGGGATFVDIDNDQDLDLYVCGYDTPNRLFINQGNGTFVEQAETYGLDFRGASVMMSFADYDGDGDLDGYLLTNRLMPTGEITGQITFQDGKWVVPPAARELMYVVVTPDGRPKMLMGAQYDHLYRNNGPGKKFTDVSEPAGIAGNYYGLSAIWWDYNDDGRPDLYVANDFYGPDHLYRNDGLGKFSDVAQMLLPRTPWYSMGSDVADINNDGRLDLMGSDMAGATHVKSKMAMGEMDNFDAFFLTHPEPRQVMQNTVYLNTGTDRFMEVASLVGLSKTNWTWSVKFGDLDNDGRVDLFISNGMTREWLNRDLRKQAEKLGGLKTAAAWKMWLDSPQQREANLAYQNLGDLKFAEVGARWGLDRQGVSFGAALGDLDRDGDLDLVVNNFDEPVSVYRNRGRETHCALIRLVGTRSNSYGIGATVRVWTAGVVQAQTLTLARGFMSANEPLLHFGLGRHAVIDRLTVRWPSGHTQTCDALAADRLYRIREPSAPPPSPEPASRPPTMFARSEALQGIRHTEKPYNDFARQPLLANKLSQLGPGLAWGDVDGDGDDDLFVGGAAGQAGTLLTHAASRRFQRQSVPALTASAAREDMGAVFFDVEGDGDVDLYVVSGGVECEPDDPLLRDRLYLNEGAGVFDQAADEVLPDVRDSGSVVAAADFDRDGDLDLFVGSRVIPGQYPLSPASRLLRNDSTDSPRLTDVTDEVAPGLRTSGLVTSAVWSDADGDGWLDLVVTHEWGPIKLYRNDHGVLADSTVEAGLAGLLGWWNGVAARDIDNDGDIDYAVTNFGLNTKYGQPSAEKPIVLYYGDFDDSGHMRLVEAMYEDETLLPVRGKSCSQDAIPRLRYEFPTYRQFARASLAEIYSPDRLDKAHRWEVNTLASGALINDGKGRFTFQPLPRLAQASPGFGVILGDFDGDARVDLYLVQNFFTPQRETPRMDGGVSLLLLGGGERDQPRWEPVWPDRSGLVIPGDAKALTTADVNQDGWLDLVVSVNDNDMVTCVRQGPQPTGMLLVRLQAPPPNTTAVGARVTVHLDDGTQQTAEVQAGGGYLSQSSSILAFGTGREDHTSVKEIEVRWPNGRASFHQVPSPRAETVVIHQP